MQQNDYRATLIVISGLAAATVTGFLRQAVTAYQLGAGRGADIYLVAFAIPEFIFIALPIVLWPVFIPLFTQCRQQGGEAVAWRFALRVVGALSVVLAIFTIGADLAAPLYLRWLAPGFSAADHHQTIRAITLMLPALSLMSLATLIGAMLQVYRQFARPVLMVAAYNLTFILTLLALPLAEPLDRAAWGVTLGAAAALLLQLPLLWRHRPPAAWLKARDGVEPLGGGPPKGSTPYAPNATIGSITDQAKRAKTVSPHLVQVARLAGLLAVGYAIHHLILLIDRAWATSLGTGSAAALNYAYHLALVAGQISGLAVSTVLFPRLAEQINTGDTAAAHRSLADALRPVWLIALPAGAALIVLRVPLIRLLLERGAFDQAATAAVSAPLVWYTLAVLADALCQPLWRVVYAQQGARTVLVVNSLQTGLRLATNFALIPIFGYSGLAISAFLGLAVQAIILGGWTQHRLGKYLSGAWWQDAGRVVLGTAASLLAMATLSNGLLGSASPWLQILLAGSLGGLVYLAALWLLGLLKRSDIATLTIWLPCLKDHPSRTYRANPANLEQHS